MCAITDSNQHVRRLIVLVTIYVTVVVEVGFGLCIRLCLQMVLVYEAGSETHSLLPYSAGL